MWVGGLDIFGKFDSWPVNSKFKNGGGVKYLKSVGACPSLVLSDHSSI